MHLTFKQAVLWTVGVAAVATSAFAAFAYSGSYNVGADEPHNRLVYATLEAVRDRSIAVHAAGLTAPDLSDQTRIRKGAGNYAAMCATCHLAPGVESSELSSGLYPQPPNLTREGTKAEEAFWVIKHGIKASGMPAWGKSMDDESIWNLVAFLKVLPTLDDPAYDHMVGSSGGHSHGGGEAGDTHKAGSGHSHSEEYGGAHSMASGAGVGSSHMHGAMHNEEAPHAHDSAPHMEMPAAGSAASVDAPAQAAQPSGSTPITTTPTKPVHGHDPSDGHHHAPKH